MTQQREMDGKPNPVGVAAPRRDQREQRF